jgi:hypothetical protein
MARVSRNLGRSRVVKRKGKKDAVCSTTGRL